MEGGVNGALSVVIDAGPEGGARFMAGAEISGTNAGGTGGGRSLNICAVAGAAIPEMIQPASASASTRRSSRLDRSMPSAPEAMAWFSLKTRQIQA